MPTLCKQYDGIPCDAAHPSVQEGKCAKGDIMPNFQGGNNAKINKRENVPGGVNADIFKGESVE